MPSEHISSQSVWSKFCTDGFGGRERRRSKYSSEATQGTELLLLSDHFRVRALTPTKLSTPTLQQLYIAAVSQLLH